MKLPKSHRVRKAELWYEEFFEAKKAREGETRKTEAVFFGPNDTFDGSSEAFRFLLFRLSLRWSWHAVSCVASVYHRMTFQGPCINHLTVFSADHRLAFRVLPAEGLLVQTHEATSHTTLLAGANEELRRRRRAGLSSREYGHSSLEAQVFRDTAASSLPRYISVQ